VSTTRLAEQFAEAQSLQQQGNLGSARQIYQAILEAAPDHFDTLNAMGVLAGQSRDLQLAIQYFDRAIEAQPANPGAHCNRGLALRQLAQPQAALACFDRAILLDAENAIAYYSRAETYRELARNEQALADYDSAVALNPGFLPAHYRRGLVLQSCDRLEEAIACYDRALQLNPDHVDSHAGKALALFALGRHADALSHCDRAIALRPAQAAAFFLRGKVLRALSRQEAALASYDASISIDPANEEAHFDRATVLQSLGRYDDALASFDAAIALKRDYVEAYFQRGYLHRMCNRFEASAADYRRVAELAPEFGFLPGARLEASLQVCDFSDFDGLVGQITSGLERGQQVAHPFILMALLDSAQWQQQAAHIWVNHACPADDSLGAIARRGPAAKITIGYFSPDLHQHPVGRLLAELIEIHDRSRFEVIAFSFGPRTQDELQQRLMQGFDRFVDVSDRSNPEIASLARSLGVDIAVDLCGHTFNNRAGIFALRAAPVQVNYLGYLGTTGASYIDYIVGDRTVVTADSEKYFSERVIYLPDCHQVNDRKRRMADKVFTRSELGLPQSGAVFCCFNTSYKISPATFAGWMRILKAVSGSSLLLQADHELTRRNLRALAARLGVDPHRLIFGERLPPPEYLARYRAADLFLDTLPYNAGATASDALWTGLPVLTLAGQSFAGRIAASLLTAVGLPELITATQQDYERLAIELVSNPQRLSHLRNKLVQNRSTSPLFDTPRFARGLEAAYIAIHERYRSGLAPQHVEL
jgi:predicted O-linked N-acetylglucosamine transferase (SPINDLY family)